MSSELLKISDFAEVKGGKRLPKGSNLVPIKTEHPYLRIVDYKDGTFDRTNLQYVPDDVFPKIQRYTITSNDVFISIVGTIGLIAVVPSDLSGASLTENAAKICNIDLTRVDRDYLKYYLSSEQGQRSIREMAVGSTQPKLALFRIEQIKVPCPTLVEQKEIAKILQSFDDRIALLRETNATLEAIAQALFKSWFVDFDPVHANAGTQAPSLPAEIQALFPSRLVESPQGRIPEGWEVTTLDDVSEVGIGKTPPRKEQHWFSENSDDIRWVSIRDMGESGAYLSSTNEYLTKEAVTRFNVRVVPDNTVMLSFKMTIGRVAISDGEMTTNEAIAHFKLTETSPLSSEFIYLHLKSFDYSTLSSTSSIADAVNSKTVKNIPIALPVKDVLREFQSIIHPVMQRIKLIEQQIKTVSNLRDTLLPRLISGQLRLPEAEAALAEVG